MEAFLNSNAIIKKAREPEPFNQKTYNWRSFLERTSLMDKFTLMIKDIGDKTPSTLAVPAEYAAENCAGMVMNMITISSAPLLIALGMVPTKVEYDKIKNVKDLKYLVPCYHAIYLAFTYESLPIGKRIGNLSAALKLFLVDTCLCADDFSLGVLGRVITNVKWAIWMTCMKSSSKYAPLFCILEIVIPYYILRSVCCMIWWLVCLLLGVF